jgi:hypothetical protein
MPCPLLTAAAAAAAAATRYAENLPQLESGRKISPNPADWRCDETGVTENLWLNLSTGHIGSGRKVSSLIYFKQSLKPKSNMKSLYFMCCKRLQPYRRSHSCGQVSWGDAASYGLGMGRTTPCSNGMAWHAHTVEVSHFTPVISFKTVPVLLLERAEPSVATAVC